ncbi:hypothetical protein [Metabacillus niabensis]|uniref:hypothetical protein n=1 Tax=Metabacillus niabensis TaxID=324854 RepID=UPI0039A0693B
MQTGILDYDGKKCVYKLTDFILEIEEIENRDKIFIEDLDKILGVQSLSKEHILLKGKDFESGSNILFKVRSLNQTGFKTYRAKIISYIIFDNEDTTYDGIQITSDELNWFHNVGESYSSTWDFNTGESELKLKSYESTAKEFYFNLSSFQKIKGTLNISRKYSQISTMPLRLQTEMSLYFQETNDLDMAEQLVFITKRFLNFITYRKNTTINQIILKKRNPETDKYRRIGTVFINGIDNNSVEPEKLVKERLIDIKLLGDQIGELFNKINEDQIYLTHIPENSKEWNIITASRFIMITAGFEWQFRSTYNEKSNENEEKNKEHEEEIFTFLDEKIEQYTGKKKKYFKDIKKLIQRSNMTLLDKISWALNKFDDVLKDFINSIYSLNDIQENKYKDISERIQTQRNNIAHGNIDKEFNPIVILDLSVLEWLYYAMVLNDIGVPREDIKRSINRLFKRGFAL